MITDDHWSGHARTVIPRYSLFYANRCTCVPGTHHSVKFGWVNRGYTAQRIVYKGRAGNN